MKKRNSDFLLILFILLIIGSTSLSGRVAAHSPDDMDLVYDESNSKLMVFITHEVENRTIHYINGVKICVQESTVKTINYTNQPTNDTFQYQYDIVAVKGDKLKVAAYCNNGGEIHEDLVVGSVQSSLDIPGYTNFLIICVAIIAIMTRIVIKRIKRKK